jgi:NADPH2:quinone reductase
MFAHRIVEFTGPDGVRWTEGEEPAAEGGVVIDVVAAGVSYADLLQTNGAYQMKVPLPFTPGMDAAGVVRSAPRRWSGCGPTRCSTRVVWLLAGGHQCATRAGCAFAG